MTSVENGCHFFCFKCATPRMHKHAADVHFSHVLLRTCFASVQRLKTLRIFMVFCMARLKIVL